jgi:hypothetical protein
MPEKTPQERAMEAAEQLAAEGRAVTARAVRELAHVSMDVAAPVAKSWNDQQVQAREVPAVPDLVRVRMDALWREAFEAARAQHQAERDGWAANIKALKAERDDTIADTIKVEKERDQLNTRITELEAALQQALDAAAQAQAAVLEAQARTTAAEAATIAAEAVASALQNAFAALSPRTEDRAQVGIDGTAEELASEGDVVAKHDDASRSTDLAGS